MADAELEAIKARVEAATPGPWDASAPDEDGESIVGAPGEWWDWDHTTCEHYDDAVFIAHARTDVPALVAEVERLRAANDRLAQRIGYWHSRYAGHPVVDELHALVQIDRRAALHPEEPS